jgi:hypothetical protein
VKGRRARELVDFAVVELNSSRSLRAGMLQVATGESSPSQRMAKKLFENTDAKADAHCDWLLDPAALSRAGFKKLLRGWHDAAALAAVDSWPLGYYDLLQHSQGITKVDRALAELTQRFPRRYSWLQAACEAADLPPLLYAPMARGTRTDAARQAVNAEPPTPNQRTPPDLEETIGTDMSVRH